MSEGGGVEPMSDQATADDRVFADSVSQFYISLLQNQKTLCAELEAIWDAKAADGSLYEA